MTSPLLSIITVNLNNREGLQHTIDSVVGQTFTDYEWIVIDGGSTDGSRELIEQYADRFAYWVSEPDKGIYNAMNKGIAHAKGEWLQFLNSGDWLYENTTLKKVFSKKYEADIIYGNTLDISSTKEKLQNPPHTITASYLREYALCHQSMFFRGEIFNNCLFDEELMICSDWALYYKLIFENYSMQYIPECISTYEGGGISQKQIENATNERKYALDKFTPTHLKEDLEYICTVKNHERFINSHKSYIIVYKIANIIILFLSKIIKIFETLRIRFR